MNPESDIRVHIATSSIFKVLFILAGAVLLWYLRDILLILLTSIVIASAMEPGVRWLVERGLPRVLAVVVVYVIIAGLFGGVLYFFVPLVLRDAASFLTRLPDTLQAIGGSSGSVLSLPLSDIASIFSSADFVQNLSNALSGSTSSLLSAVSAFFGGLISFGLVVVLSFYFLVQETGVDDFLVVVTPPRYHDYVSSLWKRSQDKIGRWMQGQLLLGFIVGILLFLGLTILQVPYALLLAVMAALCELIPVFGQIFAMIPAATISFGHGGTTLALLVIGLYLLVQQFESNLIYPLVVRKVVGVPPLLVILALLIGGRLAGFIGILLSVPLATTVRELVSDLEKRRVLAREQK